MDMNHHLSIFRPLPVVVIPGGYHSDTLAGAEALRVAAAASGAPGATIHRAGDGYIVSVPPAR